MSCPNDLCGFVYGDTALAGIVAGFINKRVFCGHSSACKALSFDFFPIPRITLL